MTFAKETTLYCDADDCFHDFKGRGGAGNARYQAPDGWSNYGRWDYCPEHAPSDNSDHDI